VADAPEDKGQEAPLERHLFAAGGDVNTAEAKLLGLLSEADLDGRKMTAAGPVEEESDPPVVDKAPSPSEDEPVEEIVEDGDPPLGEETGEEEQPLEDEFEYEYVDEDGNVIEDPEETAETYTVLVDGKEHEVTMDELTNGYSFRAHNTQKSQELAKARKEVDAEAATVRESREVYGQRLKQVEQALVESYPQEPDWDTLEKEDPARFVAESAKWTRHVRQLEGLRAEQKRVDDENVADQTQQLETFKGEQQQLMLEAIPEWSDPEKGAEVMASEQKRLYAHALKIGFSVEEMEGLLDHRAVVLIRDSMLLSEMQSKGRKIRKGKKPPVAALKPGTRRRRIKSGRRKAVAARQRLSETGSVNDAESLLFDMLGDDA